MHITVVDTNQDKNVNSTQYNWVEADLAAAQLTSDWVSDFFQFHFTEEKRFLLRNTTQDFLMASTVVL